MTWLDSLTTKQSPTAIPLGSKGNSSTSGFLATLDKSAPKKEEDNTGIVKSLAHPFARIGTGLFNTFTGAGDVLASGIASVAGKKDTAQGFLKKAQSNITAKRDLGFFGTARPFGVAEQGVDTGKVEKGTRYAKDIVGGALELAPYVVGAPTALSAGKAGLAGLIGKSALQTGNFVGASSAVGMFGKGLQENKSLSQNLKDSTVSGAEGYAGGLLFGAAVPVVTRGIPALAKHSIVKGTGVNEATLEAPLKYGKEFRAARKNGLSRETIGKKVGGAFDTLLNNISDTGEGYNAVRESTAPVVVPTGYWTDKLKSLGITLGKDGVDRSASSRVLTQADKNAIDDFLGTYAKEGEQTASDFLKQREALANIAKYDMQKSTASTEVGKKLRAAFNNDIRPQIKGLAEIDEKYAPLVQFIKDTKRVIDKEGDVKLSSVVNSLKKGDSNVKTLKVLEELHPGITKDLEILAALEDVELASGHKVGAYASNFIFGGGVSAGLLGASGAGLPAAMAGLVGMVITNPKVVIPILEQVGIAKAVIAKIARGIKLSSAESAIVSKAMKEVEKNPTPEIRAMLALPAPSIKPPYAPKFGEPGFIPEMKSGLLSQSEAKARLLSEGKQGVYGKPLLGLPAPDKTKSGVAIPMRQSTQFEKPASIIGGKGQTSGLPLKKAEQPKITKRGLKKQPPPQVKGTPVETQKPSKVKTGLLSSKSQDATYQTLSRENSSVPWVKDVLDSEGNSVLGEITAKSKSPGATSKKMTEQETMAFMKKHEQDQIDKIVSNPNRNIKQRVLTKDDPEYFLYREAKTKTLKEFVNDNYTGAIHPSNSPHAYLNVNEIVPTEGMDARTNQKYVNELRQSIKDGKEMHPLTIHIGQDQDGVFYGLEDGHHRFEALQKEGQKRIPVQFDAASLQRIHAWANVEPHNTPLIAEAKKTKLQVSSLLDAEGESVSDLSSKIPAGEVSYTKGPIDVVKTPDGYIVLDGQHRVNEAISMNRKQIDAHVLSKKDAIKKYGDRWPHLEQIL